MREAAPPARSLVLALLLAWIGALSQLDVPARAGSGFDVRPPVGTAIDRPVGHDVAPALTDGAPAWRIVPVRTDGDGSQGSRTGRHAPIPAPIPTAASGGAATAPPREPPTARSDLGPALLGLRSIPANAPPLA